MRNQGLFAAVDEGIILLDRIDILKQINPPIFSAGDAIR